MKYVINGQSIILKIPAVNAGRFRFKKRQNNFEFGKTFSTRKNIFDDQTYLEWQISYDTDKEEETKLKDKSFIGSNKKMKYFYELSELYYESMKLKLIDIKTVNDLLTDIQNYTSFIEQMPITISNHTEINLNGIQFKETSINLPTLFVTNTTDKTQIEVSIEKQQYATGVQPMVYFCIPSFAFGNFEEFHNKSSKRGEELEYIINKDNVSNLTSLIKVFGMASNRHKHDIIKILKIILK